MTEPKTRQNQSSVQKFLKSVTDSAQRRDAKAVVKLMREVTGERPAMWGDSIVGFGRYHYKYASGREGDWFVMGMSPRKAALTLYLMCDLSGIRPVLGRLGKHKTGKGCLYIRRLSDVDPDVLREALERTLATARKS